MLLAFAGDVSLHNNVSDKAFEHVAKQLTCPLLVNLESVLAEDESTLQPTRDKVLLRSPAKRLKLLKALPVAAVCLANNHIGDYGDIIAGRTIELCATDYPTFGAGLACDPFHRYLHKGNATHIAFIAYCLCDTSPLHTTATRIGPRDFDRQTWPADVAWARKNAQHVVVILHWGAVHSHCPRPDQVQLARQLVDSGADLVVGAHSHAVQGYENYHGQYIFYSLGNFLFPDVRVKVSRRVIEKRQMLRNRWGLVPVFDFGSEGIELRHLWTVEETSEIPKLADSERFYRRLEHFSRWIQSADLEAISRSVYRRERFYKRFEEFWLRDNKPRILQRKLRKVLANK